MDQTAAGTSMDTANTDAMSILKQLKTEVYHDSIDELALGLGRPTEEISAWFEGSEEIDEDAEMKIRRLAQERLGNQDDSFGAANEDKNTEQRI
jgi:hypothetical protein